MWTVPSPASFAEGNRVQTHPCPRLRSLHAQPLSAGHTNYKRTNNFGSFTLQAGRKLNFPISWGREWGAQSFGVRAACAVQDTALQVQPHLNPLPLSATANLRGGLRVLQTVAGRCGFSPAARYISHGASRGVAPLFRIPWKAKL